MEHTPEELQELFDTLPVENYLPKQFSVSAGEIEYENITQENAISIDFIVQTKAMKFISIAPPAFKENSIINRYLISAQDALSLSSMLIQAALSLIKAE
jgi:hypothetical protein